MKPTGWRPSESVFNHLEDHVLNKNVAGIKRPLHPILSLALIALAATGTIGW